MGRGGIAAIGRLRVESEHPPQTEVTCGLGLRNNQERHGRGTPEAAVWRKERKKGCPRRRRQAKSVLKIGGIGFRSEARWEPSQQRCCALVRGALGSHGRWSAGMRLNLEDVGTRGPLRTIFGREFGL